MSDIERKDMKKTQAQEGGAECLTSDISHLTSELGGPKGPEPTRFGDWEIKGKCVDF